MYMTIELNLGFVFITAVNLVLKKSCGEMLFKQQNIFGKDLVIL